METLIKLLMSNQKDERVVVLNIVDDISKTAATAIIDAIAVSGLSVRGMIGGIPIDVEIGVKR